jgi:phosphoglycerate dehydrogenase-like enzyme
LRQIESLDMNTPVGPGKPLRLVVYTTRPEHNGPRYRQLLLRDIEAKVFAAKGGAVEAEFISSPDVIEAGIAEADALLTFGTIVDTRIIGAAKALRWIHSLISGTDWLAGLGNLSPDVLVTSARGMHGPPVSEMAILLMMALSRRLPFFIGNQRQARWERASGGLLFGRTVGLLGVGTIGQDLASRLRALGMTTVGISSKIQEVPGFDRVVTRGQLVEVAPELDFLVTLLPLTPESLGIVNSAVFEAMRPDAFLVHLSRGPVVSEHALLDALRSGAIAGAGLDVFDVEPLPADHPFWTMENVIITPHNAGIYDRYADDSYVTFAKNLGHFVSGRADEMVNRVTRGQE